MNDLSFSRRFEWPPSNLWDNISVEVVIDISFGNELFLFGEIVQENFPNIISHS